MRLHSPLHMQRSNCHYQKGSRIVKVVPSELCLKRQRSYIRMKMMDFIISQLQWHLVLPYRKHHQFSSRWLAEWLVQMKWDAKWVILAVELITTPRYRQPQSTPLFQSARKPIMTLMCQVITSTTRFAYPLVQATFALITSNSYRYCKAANLTVDFLVLRPLPTQPRMT